MRNINFTCDKKWDEMDSLSHNTKYCIDCKKNVRDYSTVQNDSIEVETQCGKFKLSQIDSFNRSITLNSSSLIQISLIALLGISLPNEIKANRVLINNDNLIQSDSTILKLQGQLLDADNKKPLATGAIELYNEDSLISVDMTDRLGNFELNVDTSIHDIQNLKVVFNRNFETSDTTNIKIQDFKNIKIELKIYSRSPYIHEYVITGDVTSVNDSSINCHFKKEPRKAKEIKKKN